MLLIHSTQDDLTSSKSADFVYRHISSEIKEYIKLENSYHLIVMDNEREFVFEKCIEFMNMFSDFYMPKDAEVVV